MTNTNTSTIAANIRNWDMQSVHYLRDQIAALRLCRDDNGDEIDTQHWVDMTSLPSAPLPADIDASWPIWAVDVNGMALVGDDATGVMSLDEIRHQQNA